MGWAEGERERRGGSERNEGMGRADGQAALRGACRCSCRARRTLVACLRHRTLLRRVSAPQSEARAEAIDDFPPHAPWPRLQRLAASGRFLALLRFFRVYCNLAAIYNGPRGETASATSARTTAAEKRLSPFAKTLVSAGNVVPKFLSAHRRGASRM